MKLYVRYFPAEDEALMKAFPSGEGGPLAVDEEDTLSADDKMKHLLCYYCIHKLFLIKESLYKQCPPHPSCSQARNPPSPLGKAFMVPCSQQERREHGDFKFK